MKVYSYSESLASSLDYFKGDELAAKVMVDKYALRDNEQNLVELNPSDMHWRLASEFARIEKDKFKSPLSKEQIFSYFDHFKKIIPQGSPMYGIGNLYQVVSLSNCYVLESPVDSYAGILKTDEQLVQISKRRGGVGLDVSHLRPAGATTHNAARTSTGIIPFVERYSNSIREVGQHGRRGALMVTLSIHHPEVLEFANVKKDLTKVTGANISVRLTDEFLKAVENDSEYELRWPVDAREKGKEPEISKKVRAKDIWNELIKNAWLMAEPGLLMWDNIIGESPADCYKEFKSTATNPCCLAVDSTVWVITKKGYKEIKDIVEGDEVWVDDIYGFKKSSVYFKVGIHDVYRVIFDSGNELVVTSNHKLQRVNELVEIKDLKVGDFIQGNSYDPITRQILFSDHADESHEVEIVSIEYIGRKEVGCIDVEDAHKFTANGIISGNSEIPLCPFDSCRLLVINLYNYVKNPFTETASFDFKEFYQDAQIAQRLMDDMIDLELECIDKIIKKIKSDGEDQKVKCRELELWQNIRQKCEEGRRTGTGITALGDVMAAMNIKYASEESVKLTNKIYKTLKFGAYRSSIDMAKELGSFKQWDHNVEKDCPFLLRIKGEKLRLNKDETIEGEALWNDMKKYGRRNIALLTTAPTGTVSILTQTTSGIEPTFMLSYTRRKKVNPNDKNAKIDFTDLNGDKWQEFVVYHPKVKEWMAITGQTDITKSPWYGCCAEDLKWSDRVELQATAQKHIDHAISSTLNLPEDVSLERVSEIYKAAWKSGCKGVTIYRKNCRTGVLIETKDDQKIQPTSSPKRPKSLPCSVYHVKITKRLDKLRTFDYLVVVGLLNGDPYEVFVMENGHLDKKYTSGQIVKKSRGHYYVQFTDGTLIEDITKNTSEMEDSITRMTSTALRHGAGVEFIVHQLEKAEGDMWSFCKAMARALKKHIKDGAKVHGDSCPKCNGNNLERREGCITCVDCGHSKCG